MQVKRIELLQLGHFLEARVGDFGVPQTKPVEILQLGHFLEASVGDFGVAQVKPSELLQLGQLLKARIGYFGADGEMDTCITLRTGLIKDETLFIQAGSGIVADSDPETEYQESCNKAKALLRASEEATRFTN